MTGPDLAASVRKEANYAGLRITLVGLLAGARCPVLTQAIRATFNRRATPLPNGITFGLTEGFAQDRRKQTQWQAFLMDEIAAHHAPR